jgi:hypothetical protein
VARLATQQVEILDRKDMIRQLRKSLLRYRMKLINIDSGDRTTTEGDCCYDCQVPSRPFSKPTGNGYPTKLDYPQFKEDLDETLEKMVATLRE